MQIDVPYSIGQELFYVRPCSYLSSEPENKDKIITKYNVEKVPITHLHIHLTNKEMEVEVYVEINRLSINRKLATNVFDTEEEAIEKANELNSKRTS